MSNGQNPGYLLYRGDEILHKLYRYLQQAIMIPMNHKGFERCSCGIKIPTCTQIKVRGQKIPKILTERGLDWKKTGLLREMWMVPNSQTLNHLLASFGGYVCWVYWHSFTDPYILSGIEVYEALQLSLTAIPQVSARRELLSCEKKVTLEEQLRWRNGEFRKPKCMQMLSLCRCTTHMNVVYIICICIRTIMHIYIYTCVEI